MDAPQKGSNGIRHENGAGIDGAEKGHASINILREERSHTVIDGQDRGHRKVGNRL